MIRPELKEGPAWMGQGSSQAGKSRLSAIDHVFVQKVVRPALSWDETSHSDRDRGPLGGEASPSGAGEHVTLSRECSDWRSSARAVGADEKLQKTHISAPGETKSEPGFYPPEMQHIHTHTCFTHKEDSITPAQASLGHCIAHTHTHHAHTHTHARVLL